MVINPEYAAAEEISRILRFPSAIKIDTFSKGRVELLKFKLPENSRLVGMSVRDVISKLHCDILVCTIERGTESFIAKGNFTFEGKDIISIIASPKNASDFFKKIDFKLHSAKDVMIVGGGAISHYLCSILQKSGIAIKLIEKDREICEELCAKFPEISVIHGDGIDQNILLEEGIDKAGAFVALTNIDEENMIVSMFANKMDVEKTITQIKNDELYDMLGELGIENTVSPKRIVADRIISYIRALSNKRGSNVLTLYRLVNGQVEALEFLVKAEEKFCDKPLKSLKTKENCLIACIIRENNVIIPDGNTCICAGDGVVVVTTHKNFDDLSDIFR